MAITKPPLMGAPSRPAPSARQSPQKQAYSAAEAGPSNYEPTEHVAPQRTRVWSGKYPNHLAVTTAAPTAVVEPMITLKHQGRSVSHAVLPSTSNNDLSEPNRESSAVGQAPFPPSISTMGNAFRPHLVTSYSALSLPAIPSASATDKVTEPTRRFAPATRMARPAHPSDGDMVPLPPVTPGPHALRGAVRPTNAQQPLQPMMGGRLGLGQAQRRIIPAPVQALGPPLESTTAAPILTLKSDALKLENEVPAQKDVSGVPEQQASAANEEVIDQVPEQEHVVFTDAAKSEEHPLIDLSSEASRKAAAEEAERVANERNGGALQDEKDHNSVPHDEQQIVETAPIMLDNPITEPITVHLQEEPKKDQSLPPTKSLDSTGPSAISADGPNKTSRKPNVPPAARRPATGATSTKSSSLAKPAVKLPPVATKSRPVLPVESKKTFKPVSRPLGSTAATGGMNRSASGSTTVSASGLAKETGSTVTTKQTQSTATTAPPTRKASKPPIPLAAVTRREPVTGNTTVPVKKEAGLPAVVRPSKAPIPKAVLPAGYAQPTANRPITAKISSLTAPTAASAQRAAANAARVVSASSAAGKAATSTIPKTDGMNTLPPVRKEKMKMKPAMPSFRPTRGRTVGGPGAAPGRPAVSTAASSRAVSAAPDLTASTASNQNPVRPLVAKVRDLPITQPKAAAVPTAAEVPLPGSPGARPIDVPLPSSPVVEYRGTVRVKKASLSPVRSTMASRQADSEQADDDMAVIVEKEGEAEMSKSSKDELLRDMEPMGDVSEALPEVAMLSHSPISGHQEIEDSDDSSDEEDEPIEHKSILELNDSADISADGLLLAPPRGLSLDHNDQGQADLIAFSASTRDYSSQHVHGDLAPTAEVTPAKEGLESNDSSWPLHDDRISPRAVLLEKDANHLKEATSAAASLVSGKEAALREKMRDLELNESPLKQMMVERAGEMEIV